MIINFKCNQTEQIWNQEYTKLIPKQLHKIALRKLRMLNASNNLSDLKIPPANRLHPLKNNLKGYWAIRINQNYRVVFKWDEETGNATNVYITDYHK